MFSTTVFGCAFHLPRVHEDWATVSEPTWRRQLTEAAHRHLSEEFTKRRENLVVRMGGSDSKLNFRKAVVQLTTKKTVSKVMKMYSQLSFSRSLAEGFVGLNLLLVNVHLINSPKSILSIVSGCRSDRWHLLGSVLVWVVGDHQWRFYFDSCLGNQSFTRRESLKFGDALLQGECMSWHSSNSSCYEWISSCPRNRYGQFSSWFPCFLIILMAFVLIYNTTVSEAMSFVGAWQTSLQLPMFYNFINNKHEYFCSL